MKCSKAIKMISPYLDGELKPEERARIEAHIRTCYSCNSLADDFRGMSRRFSGIQDLKAPSGFSQKVMTAVEAKETKYAFHSRFVFRFAEAVAMVVVLVSGSILGSVMVKKLVPEKTGHIFSSFSIEFFEPAPPGSLASAYLAMMEVRHEK